ncbi:hypothetical protein I6F35_02875 [Bradyrhizobium sp. BRP22]|uniref:hypothetical protein n=1 Tax=Bradyrhizobium sp. BRP22 TaxID=2793821 RepID=UPI001CD24AED|nr:hypothetical protein [Bradyrhizobium sp. BRP22]MCA1452158.1 hypothetical protein [Bradyrhizobium sp. BRP22]
MNVGRGLFRAWVLISVLWIIGAGFVAYTIVAPDTIRGVFQPAGATKGGLNPWAVDYRKPFYETMRSPSAEKLSVQFFEVQRTDQTQWDKDSSMAVVEMPDGSRLYMHDGYNDADKDYIARQFWDQRWGRWGYAAGVVTAWAFVPCILLFIFGYSLLWVGRGFGRS